MAGVSEGEEEEMNSGTQSSGFLPKRIQRKRTKGWKMPEGAVIVSRPTIWGNPFIVNTHVRAGARSGCENICVPTLEDAVACFREYVIQKDELRARVVSELRGKDLACWCPLDQLCHADVLLEIANAQEGSEG